MKIIPLFMASALAATAGGAHAEAPGDFLRQFQDEARAASASFIASAPRGESFFTTVHGKDWSCASCHTRNPAAAGKHETTGKPIEPLAPVANAERFTSARAVGKWFKRNCNDVLGRECSAAEKADVLAYLINVKR